MTTSERREVTNHLFASVNDKALCDDKSRIGFFVRSGGLMPCTKSYSYNLIKHQGVIQKIVPEVFNHKDYEEPNTSEIVPPTGTVSPENDSKSSDIHDDDLINDMTDLVISQDSYSEVQLEAPEVLEQVRTI